MSIKKVIEKAKKLAAEGNATKVIRAHLTIDGVSDKIITIALKEAGLQGHRAGWTQTDTLAYLEGGVSERSLYEKLLEEESKNEARWVNDRNRIRLVINRVFEKYGEPVAEESASKELKEAVKALWK